MKLLLRWLLNAIGLWVATVIIPGVAASGWQALVVAALLLVAWLVPGFAIDGLFWAGLLAALWMSLFGLSTQWAVKG